MDDKTFEKCLNIAQRHVDFLKEHREDGVFSKEENDELIADYERKIKKGRSLLEESHL